MRALLSNNFKISIAASSTRITILSRLSSPVGTCITRCLLIAQRNIFSISSFTLPRADSNCDSPETTDLQSADFTHLPSRQYILAESRGTDPQSAFYRRYLVFKTSRHSNVAALLSNWRRAVSTIHNRITANELLSRQSQRHTGLLSILG